MGHFGFLLVSSTQRAGYVFTMPLARDLLHPTAEEERRRHKLKRLVQHPNSYFMDGKCPGCYKITTVFSHAQTVAVCWLLCCSVPTYWWPCQVDRRLFFPQETTLRE